MRFISRQADEIAEDTVLRYYGAALALVGTLTAVFWLTVHPLDRILSPNATAICWPFWENCYRWRFFGGDVYLAVVLALALTGAWTAFLFLKPDGARQAYWLLGASIAVRTLILLQDYRLVLNQHYMALWVTLTFLFVPSKRTSIRYLIIVFYLWAGLLKFGPEWTSGVGLYGRRPFGMPQALIPAACTYVVVLELCIAPALLANRGWLFWPAFLQILLFHVGSFWVVGFFYPILMFLLLAIFPLVRFSASVAECDVGRPARQVAVARGAPRVVGGVLVAWFSALQLVPRLFPGDVSVTGEGRMFALNMFDAPLECRVSAEAEGSGQNVIVANLRVPYLNPRIACDPIVYLGAAKAACRTRADGPTFDDFHLTIETRKFGQSQFRPVVTIRSFCSTNPRYSVWRHNEWLQAR
jgi:hypothetical protein